MDEILPKIQINGNSDSTTTDPESPNRSQSADTLSNLEENNEVSGDFTNAVSSTINSEKPICCGEYAHDYFYKGCKWSPDSNSNRLLTCDGNNRLRIYHAFLNKNDYSSSQISSEFYKLENIGKIYDFQWFPLVSPTQYDILTATSLGPIHIWNMASSKHEASYRMFDTKDEAVHAHCIACSENGMKIYGATADYIFIFDTVRPGRTYDRILTRGYLGRGIISAIVLNPIRNSLFAAGSYNGQIGIYDENQLLCTLVGHNKGITHLKFSPDGSILYSGVRGSGEINCWDLRNPGTALYKLERSVKTQQRIYFDVTTNGRFVISGSTNGEVLVWDTLLSPINNVLPPAYTFQAHNDCTNGVSMNSHSPILATVSGQYHDNYLKTLLDDSDEEDSNRPSSLNIENSLKLWHVQL